MHHRIVLVRHLLAYVTCDTAFLIRRRCRSFLWFHFFGKRVLYQLVPSVACSFASFKCVFAEHLKSSLIIRDAKVPDVDKIPLPTIYKMEF